MSGRLRVAGAQIGVSRDVAANEAAIGRAIEFGRREQADVVLTPEGSLSGYTSEFDQREVADALARVTAAAHAAGVGLALGTCFVEPDDGLRYNQLRFYERDGTYLGFHNKILAGWLVDVRRPPDAPRRERRRDTFRPLRTFGLQGATVGGLICNDLWANPRWTPMDDTHLTQQLSGMGAQVVLHGAFTGPRDNEWATVAWQYHESNLRMRARAGALWIVTVSNGHPGGVPGASPSGVLNPDGGWELQTDPGDDQFFAYTIQLES